MYKVRFHYIGDFVACQWVWMRFSVVLRVYDSRLVDSHKFLLQSHGGWKGTPRLKLRRGEHITITWILYETHCYHQKYEKRTFLFHLWPIMLTTKIFWYQLKRKTTIVPYLEISWFCLASLGVEITPRFYRGREKASAMISGRAGSKPKKLEKRLNLQV